MCEDEISQQESDDKVTFSRTSSQGAVAYVTVIDRVTSITERSYLILAANSSDLNTNPESLQGSCNL